MKKGDKFCFYGLEVVADKVSGDKVFFTYAGIEYCASIEECYILV